MPATDELLIRVQTEWNGWRSAEIRLRDLKDVHWFRPNHAPQTLLHGYVSCSTFVSGDLPHDCDRAAAPHRLLVCVLKKHMIPSVYAEIARRADEQQYALRPGGRGAPRTGLPGNAL